MHNLFTSMYNSTLLIYISTFGWVQSDKSPHVRNVASLRQIWFMRVSGIPSKRHCCNAFPWLPCMVFGMFKTYRYCWYLVCLKHTDIVSEKFKNHFLLKPLLLSLTSSRACNRDNLCSNIWPACGVGGSVLMILIKLPLCLPRNSDTRPSKCNKPHKIVLRPVGAAARHNTFVKDFFFYKYCSFFCL